MAASWITQKLGHFDNSWQTWEAALRAGEKSAEEQKESVEEEKRIQPTAARPRGAEREER